MQYSLCVVCVYVRGVMWWRASDMIYVYSYVQSEIAFFYSTFIIKLHFNIQY